MRLQRVRGLGIYRISCTLSISCFLQETHHVECGWFQNMSLRDYLSTQKWAILSLRRIAKSMKRPIATILRLIFPISRSSKLLEFKSGFSLIVPSWYHFQSIAETILLNAYHFPPLGTVTGCVIDVGASIGDFVISVRLSGHKGRIYAFEPDPISFGILQKNIELNDLH